MGSLPLVVSGSALDVPVPSVITWGYGDGALVSLRTWLEGRAGAPGRAPVPLR